MILFFIIMPVVGMCVVVSTITTTCLSAMTVNDPIRSICVWGAVGRGSGDSDVAERRTSHSKSATAAEPYEISEYEVAVPYNGARCNFFSLTRPLPSSSFLFSFSLQTPCSVRRVWT